MIIETIQGRTFSLKAATPSDMPLLLRYRNDPDWIRFCTHRKYHVSLEQFDREIRNDFSHDRWLQYIIRSRQSIAVGTVYAYQYDPELQATFVTLFVEEGARKTPAAAHGLILLCEHLFQLKKPPVKKVLMHVYADNARSLKPLQRIGAGLLAQDVSKSGDPRALFEISSEIAMRSDRARRLIKYAIN